MIDRQEVIERINRQMPDRIVNAESYSFANGLRVALSQVEYATEINAVNPIRCRNCKYMSQVDRYKHPEVIEEYYCQRTGRITYAYDYCSRGIEDGQTD